MSRIDAMLILACRGYKDDGFKYCHTTNNPILELSELDDFEYEKIIDFFDNACGLFDSSVADYNKCSNILNILYKTHKVIDSEMLSKIQYYLTMHKRCSPYLVLMLREDYENGRE